MLASGSRALRAKLWDVATGEEIAGLRTSGRVYAVSFSPDGRTLATAGTLSPAQLWDVATGEQIATLRDLDWPGHRSAAYSPGGTILATGGDGVTLWRVANSGADSPTAVDARGKAGSTWAHVKQAARMPRATAFLPNYPNPFNPETWIPFDLHGAAEVTITIHDATGSIVRTLDLGRRPAGAYLTRDRAAYWDGRNDHGEAVSSGVYFVQLVAGDHRSTRRVALWK
jgi:hypothetical protein